LDVRKATSSDIEAAIGLAERSRRQYQKYQPTFWRKAPDSVEKTRTYFTGLLGEQGTYFLVAVEGRQLLGFVIARKFPAPPVHAPGADTYLIDDFCVAEPHHWLTIGEALLSHATTLLHEHGAAQVVVVCGDRDLPKAEMLRRSDLTIASSWWTKALG
jgi:ribosomal protein S18 acetylase RimI-like enzyme